MNRLDVISKINCLEDTLKDTKGNVYVNKKEVTRIISQAVEPKVTIPKFIAGWIKYCKGKGISCRGSMGVSITPKEVNKWLSETECVATNEEVFFNAWFYGYNTENEPLYTVTVGGTVFAKFREENRFKYGMVHTRDILPCVDKSMFITELTEDEIKGYDKHLWEFAVPVEE